MRVWTAETERSAGQHDASGASFGILVGRSEPAPAAKVFGDSERCLPRQFEPNDMLRAQRQREVFAQGPESVLVGGQKRPRLACQDRDAVGELGTATELPHTERKVVALDFVGEGRGAEENALELASGGDAVELGPCR